MSDRDNARLEALCNGMEETCCGLRNNPGYELSDADVYFLRESAAEVLSLTGGDMGRLKDWVMRIRYCAIACNNEGIKDVVSEISAFYWKAEGEE